MAIEKKARFLINVAYFGVIFLAAFVCLRYLIPLAAPFLIGFVIAYALKRPIALLEKQLGLPHKAAAILATILFYAVFGVLFTLLGIKAFSGLVLLIRTLPTMYDTHVLPFFTDILHNVERVLAAMDPALVQTLNELGENALSSMGDTVSGLSVEVMGLATGVAAAIPGLFIKLVLMIISSFFIAIDYDRLTGFCLRQMQDGTKEVFFQIKEYLVGTLWVCIRSYIIIISITFVELSIGLSLICIRHAVVIALVIAVFDILPVLGTGGIMIPWAILTAVQGSYGTAIGLFAIYLVITVVRNIVEPKIVGSQLGLHPIVTLSCMFIGLQLFGVVGLFGFPILLSLLRHLNDHGVIRLFR